MFGSQKKKREIKLKRKNGRKEKGKESNLKIFFCFIMYGNFKRKKNKESILYVFFL